MKSGKIKKTTSYIMAIPMNDKDIDTPQMVYDRINANDEFELKETSFDDKNMCPMVTVVYKGQQYIVDIKIEPVNITPDFMFCHDMPDECIKKMKKAKIGITTSLTFTDDIMESYHFQLKFLNCIIPDKAAVVDFNTHRIFSPLWIKSVAVSSVSPGPNYVFSVNMLRDKNNLHWVYTYGLNRCGFYELEVLNTEKEDVNFCASVLNITANKALADNEFPNESEPMEIAVLNDGQALNVTWKNWKDEIKSYPEGTLGTGNTRVKDRCLFNGMLYIYPPGKTKKPCRANEFAVVDMENAIVKVSEKETARMEALATETISKFAKVMTMPEAKGIVKIKINTENEKQAGYEHIWAEVDQIGVNEVFATVLHDSLYSDQVKKGDRIQTEFESITDWRAIVDGKDITPDRAFLVD